MIERIKTEKLKNIGKGFLILWAIAFAVSFLNQYLHIVYHNSVRKDVFIDSVRTNGIVKSIFDGRSGSGFDIFPHSAQYYFYADSNIFNGSTFYTYKGNVGDTIYLFYKKSNPEKNLSYFDIKPEIVNRKVLNRNAIEGTAFAVIMLVITFISSWWKARKKKRKLQRFTEREQ